METEKLIKAYLKLRDARSELKREYDEKDSELLEKQDRIEAVLLEHAKANNIESMKTRAGTAYLRTKTRYWAPDWESFTKFLSEIGQDGYSLVEQRIQQSNFKQFLEEHPDVIPPVNSDSKISVVVRRSS
jgi:predicted nuclease with TOPRIM domain